jgi:uncharacterized lipoprotein YddW (UPF0748 family)
MLFAILKYRFPSTLLILFLIFFSKTSEAQIERETRAVWVATNHRLDWPPPTFDQEKQKKSLEEIFDNIKSKNLNTVYFQVRSNGTVLFKSTLDPFSSYITGKINGSATYDPLEYAVKLAHEKGLEIHAWINCVNVFSGNESSVENNPDHICQRKPEWIVEDVRDGSKSFWLDPGLPEVREYISDLIAEMVENYDVDGVHLDYIRYPGKNFDDDFSFGIYNGGLSRDDWRRNNITELIDLINKKIKAIKPYVKLGAAPIGVYKNQKGMYAWEGYTEVYQDSREWLRKGVLDYVVPQIYWGMNENPRFDLVAKDWLDNAFGRSVILGIGAYKENVKSEIGKMIQFSRSMNAGGVAFFRYSNIKDYEFKNFSYKTYPAAMAWLDGIYPDSPHDLVCKKENENIIRLDWDIKKSPSNDSIRYYALYSLPHPNSELLPDYLLDIIPADKSSIDLSIKPKQVNYYFTIKSVSKLWNESIESSNIAQIKFDELLSLADFQDMNAKPMLLKESKDNFKILLTSAINNTIIISGGTESKDQIIKSAEVSVGKNIININSDLNNYSKILIKYINSNKEYSLKLR